MKTTLPFLILTFLVLSAPHYTSAATMSVMADKNEYVEGDYVTVNVSVNTEGESMNAVQGVLTYPAENLTIVSVTQTNSVLDFWVNKPENLSNGKVSFDGVAMSPGYTGSNGIIFTAKFIANVKGVSEFDVLSASILANDGKGTEILKNIIRDKILVTQKAVYIPPSPPQESETQETVTPPKEENPEEEVLESTPATTSTSSIVEEIFEPVEDVEIPEPVLLFSDEVDTKANNKNTIVPWPLIVIFIFLILVFIVVLVFTILSFTRDRH